MLCNVKFSKEITITLKLFLHVDGTAHEITAQFEIESF